MALPIVVDSLDAIEEGKRGLYVADGDKFKLDVEGIEDVNKLRSDLSHANREAADRRKAVKELEEKYAGIDPVKVREMMAKLDQDGEAKLLAEGKIDEVVNKRTEKLRADLQKQLDEAHGKAQAAEQRSKQYSQRVLDDRIREAVTGKVHNSAIMSGDVLRAAREIFILDEHGNAVQLDADGKPVLGKDGKTAFSPAEWIESMVEIAPHWFPASSSGGGANGSGNGSNGSRTMKRAAFESLSAHEKAAAIKKYQIVD